MLDAFTGPEATAADLADIHEPLPPPMLYNNWESASDKCFIGIAFKEAVIEPGVWQYKDVSRGQGRESGSAGVRAGSLAVQGCERGSGPGVWQYKDVSRGLGRESGSTRM